MPRLSNVLNHLTGGKCVRVFDRLDDAAWTDPVKMQAALDSIVEWFPGAVIPTAQQVIAGAPVYQSWRTAEDAKTLRNANLAVHDAAGLSRPVEDTWTVMVQKSLIAKADVPAPILIRINAKRALRGEPPL